MSLFGSVQTQYLDYTVYLTDPVRVKALINSAGPNVIAKINMAPQQASILYGAPIQPDSFPASYPCTRSQYITSAAVNYPYDLASFDRDPGGWFGWLAGTTTHFIWRGSFALAPNKAGTGVVPVTPMAQRHWLDGFELPAAGGNCSRDASRHLGGYGLKFDNTTAISTTHSPIENGDYSGGDHNALHQQWERFYFRVRVLPVGGKSRLWRVRGLSSNNAGAALDLLPDGTILNAFIDAGNVETQLGVAGQGTKILVNVWHKLDLVYQFFPGEPDMPTQYNDSAYLQVFLDGSHLLTVVDQGNGHLSNQRIGTSELGGGPANGLCWDVDDWMGAGYPTGGQTAHMFDPIAYPPGGLDWLNGSRIALVGATGFGSDNAGTWAGDWRLALQRPIGNATPQLLTVAANNVRLTLSTDAAREVDAVPNSLGMAAVSVAAYQMRTAGVDGTLGFRLGALTSVVAIVQGLALQWNRVLYSFVSLQPVTPATFPTQPLELIHNTGTSESLQTLAAEVELIGIFGPEDVPPAGNATNAPTIAPDIGSHNAPYPHSPWAKKGLPPLSPVVVVGGTYIGNGTFQDLPFKVPVHFFWVRPLTGGSGGVQWWSSLTVGHAGGGEGPDPDGVLQALIDPSFNGGLSLDAQQQQTLLRIAGANANSNANGVTYQYLAISDPGERFLAAGALKVTNQTIDIVSALDDSTFTPEAAFVFQERNGTSQTVHLFYKGPGHPATAITQLQGSSIGTGLKFSNGTLTSSVGLMNASDDEIGYLAFRRNDGSQDPGIPRVLALASYVGDGAAARTISLAPVSGRYPLWAIVVPHTDVAVYRDASHTGTTSTTFPSTPNAATGITAGGLDSISVGSALNQNAVAYDVFVIPGDTVAGNNGFSINGEFIPVEPTAGTGTQFDPTPATPEENNAPADGGDGSGDTGGGGSGGGTDFTGTCQGASQQIINTALSHLGVSIQVDDVVNELTEAATCARLHYADDVDATLRAFPWPFATRYADLVLVAGTPAVPVNGDWTYAYRTPADFLFARRLVSPAGTRRSYDPRPPTFRLSSDDVGPLLYTDTVNADGLTATLEYTRRPVCAASTGDSLFRAALAWKLAHSFAPVLSKDEKKVQYCWSMFLQVLSVAATKASAEVQQEKTGGPDWLDGRDGSPDWIRGRE